MTEGLFTSELDNQGDDPEKDLKPTRTLSLSDFQRRSGYGTYQRSPRPVLPRRNAGVQLWKRAPDATVTASVVQINVNDGTTTSKLTEVPAATGNTVLSLSDLGQLTVSGVESTASSSIDNSTITTSLPTSSSGFADNSTISSTSDSALDTTSFPDNFANTTSTTEELTVTVTHTSTLEVSLFNGTIIATEAPATTSGNTPSSVRVTRTTSSSSTTTPYTFGQPVSTSLSSDSLDSSGYYGTSSSVFHGVLGTGVDGSPTATADSPATSTSDSSSDSGGGGGGGPGLTPVQQQVVGGVVGGVAGIAVILLILLVVLRWYRRRLKARGELPEQIAARQLGGGNGGEGGSHPYPMSQRSSTTPLAAAMANSFKRLRPQSSQTLATNNTGFTDPSIRDSERGFQRIAGRKIAPVLSSGGDPYGGNYGAFEKETSVGPSDHPDQGLSGASFYRDGDGFYGGKGTQFPTVPASPRPNTPGGKSLQIDTNAASKARDFADPAALAAALNNSALSSFSRPSEPEGYAVIRPSPARTPVTLSPAASSIRLPIQQVPTLDEDAPPLPTTLLPSLGVTRDEVGRSLASQDGSRVSRSSARSTGRFVENI